MSQNGRTGLQRADRQDKAGKTSRHERQQPVDGDELIPVDPAVKRIVPTPVGSAARDAAAGLAIPGIGGRMAFDDRRIGRQRREISQRRAHLAHSNPWRNAIDMRRQNRHIWRHLHRQLTALNRRKRTGSRLRLRNRRAGIDSLRTRWTNHRRIIQRRPSSRVVHLQRHRRRTFHKNRPHDPPK